MFLTLLWSRKSLSHQLIDRGFTRKTTITKKRPIRAKLGRLRRYFEWLVVFTAAASTILDDYVGTWRKWLVTLTAAAFTVSDGYVGTWREWLVALTVDAPTISDGHVGT